MAVKKFYLTSQTELRRIGLRAQIISFLMQNAIKEGNAVNDPSDKKKVIVAIKLEFTPPNAETEVKTITEIRNDLVATLNGLQSSDPECYHAFPTDLRASELSDVNNPHPLVILSMQELSASLMLEQTSKGVGAMLSLSDAIKPLANLPASIYSLADKIGKLPKL